MLIVKIALGIILAIVLMIAGCAACGVFVANQAADTLDRAFAPGITDVEADSVALGTRRRKVLRLLGRPSAAMRGAYPKRPANSNTCMYYPRKEGDGGWWQFCFRDRRLVGKTRRA